MQHTTLHYTIVYYRIAHHCLYVVLCCDVLGIMLYYGMVCNALLVYSVV